MNSTTSRDSSASCTSCIMRRSSCVVGLCTPGVSTSTTCAAGLPASVFVFLRSGSSSTPRMRVLVVCGLCVTIASFCPSSAFSSVLLPAFGLPTIDTNPVRSAIPLFSHLQSSSVITLRPHPPPRARAQPSCRSTAAPPSATAHPPPPHPAAEYARQSRSPARPLWLRRIPSRVEASLAPASLPLRQTPHHPLPQPPRSVTLAAPVADSPQTIHATGSPQNSRARHTTHPAPSPALLPAPCHAHPRCSRRSPRADPQSSPTRRHSHTHQSPDSCAASLSASRAAAHSPSLSPAQTSRSAPAASLSSARRPHPPRPAGHAQTLLPQ